MVSKSKKFNKNVTVSNKKNKIIVQSLWVGPRLSRMEQYSIKSFLNLGYEFHLYTYEKVKNVPKGTKLKDANEIMPQKEIFDLKSTFLQLTIFGDIKCYMIKVIVGQLNDCSRFDLKMVCIFFERTMQSGPFASYLPFVPNGVIKAPKGANFQMRIINVLSFKKNNNKDKLKYENVKKNDYKKDMMKYVKAPEVFCN